MELVLDHLYASEDMLSLENTALAHRSLLETSRKHLMHEIQLSEINTHSVFSSKRSLVRKLFDLLEEFPRLGDYVRVLHIEEFWDYASSLTWYSWMYEDRALPEVLWRLPNLEALYFQPHYVLSYAGMSPELMAAVEEACALPTLRTLCVFNLRGLPLYAVEGVSPALRYLRLSEVSFAHVGAAEAAEEAGAPVQLRHLALRLSEPDDLSRFADRVLTHTSRIRIDGLRSLTLTARSPSCFATTMRLLAACRATLETLEFQPTTEHSESARTRRGIDLGAAPRLRVLALSNVWLEQGHSPFPWVAHVVASAPRVAHLVLHFVVRIWNLDECVYWAGGWRALDELLASEERLPALESVTIYLDVKGYTRPNSERQTYVVHDVLMLLPRLRASGRVLTVATKQLHDEDLALCIDPLTRYQGGGRG
ncbi:hypothetical protein HDZ31DRAFT_80011 [Schizophyllum fasciatum]